ncbi:hypothetical protein HPP92_020697 [Vanilla planifolia]|uniref:Uncharacterized protein n=1 Tax=Vanilla planifolia TaxID=51239 RepID=A0A835PU88_VANPL|nr:hypothetical protein HPP92_020697 [Vanilla planifolia]
MRLPVRASNVEFLWFAKDEIDEVEESRMPESNYLTGEIVVGVDFAVKDDVIQVGESADRVEEKLGAVAALHTDDGVTPLGPVLD